MKLVSCILFLTTIFLASCSSPAIKRVNSIEKHFPSGYVAMTSSKTERGYEYKIFDVETEKTFYVILSESGVIKYKKEIKNEQN